MIATSTASGKSLCYNIPILEALVADPNATALYMFPTKALAQVSLALPFFLGWEGEGEGVGREGGESSLGAACLPACLPCVGPGVERLTEPSLP